MGQVYMVPHGDVEQALRTLKKSLQRERIAPNRKLVFEKASDKKRRKKNEAIRRLKRSRIKLNSDRK